jgi:hypothetical protein
MARKHNEEFKREEVLMARKRHSDEDILWLLRAIEQS